MEDGNIKTTSRMDHLFLSDVHLGAFPDQINRRLEEQVISLLRYCKQERIHLHILGDLFDYWMEYPDKIPSLGKDMLKEFKTYNQSFHRITYVLGNHDNWTQGYFEELGFNVASDHHHITIGGKNFFLHHGDGLSDPLYNLPRPFFHRILRSRGFTSLYQKVLPADAGLDLMKKFSSMSRETIVVEPERLNQWSEKLLDNSTFDYVICGHDHIARMETFPFGTYINLGAFYKDYLVAYYTNHELRLVKWNADESQLTPINSDLKTDKPE